MSNAAKVNRTVFAKIDEALSEPKINALLESVKDEDGNCFPMAAIVGEAARNAGFSAKVIHGKPTLTVAPFVKYDHAWVEVAVPIFEGTAHEALFPFVLDLSNGLRVLMPVQQYYLIGNISPKESVTYEADDILQIAIDNGHYGPYTH